LSSSIPADLDRKQSLLSARSVREAHGTYLAGAASVGLLWAVDKATIEVEAWPADPRGRRQGVNTNVQVLLVGLPIRPHDTDDVDLDRAELGTLRIRAPRGLQHDPRAGPPPSAVISATMSLVTISAVSAQGARTHVACPRPQSRAERADRQTIHRLTELVRHGCVCDP